MVWANFLHIYQPPTQTREILDRVTRESYEKIIAGVKANPTAKLTLNINAVLTEMLVEFGHASVISDIKYLLEKGQIELTASAKYHPLLPKLTREEIRRQIVLNEETNRKYFGNSYHPQGFFPPEMGYDEKVGEVVAQMGYKWIILDEMANPLVMSRDTIFEMENGLGVFFRERGMSFRILSAQLGTVGSVITQLGENIEKNEYLLTAMDGETFGHHRLGLEELLLEIYRHPKLPTVCVSELHERFSKRLVVTPRASTWALMPRDLARNTPFSRWDDPDNEIHATQWELVNLAMNLSVWEDDIEKKHFDMAIHSDQFWWASAKPWWSLEMIERGAYELMGAIRQFKNATTDDRNRAEALYLKIITTGFEWQRSGKVADLSRREDEEIKEMMDVDRPFVSIKEYDQMISTLKDQMKAAAAGEEYARAEQLKKRIVELSEDRDHNTRNHDFDIAINQ